MIPVVVSTMERRFFMDKDVSALRPSAHYDDALQHLERLVLAKSPQVRTPEQFQQASQDMTLDEVQQEIDRWSTRPDLSLSDTDSPPLFSELTRATLQTLADHPIMDDEALEDFRYDLEDEGLEVRYDGLLVITYPSAEILERVGNREVVLYHHTASALLPLIQEEGLLASPPEKSDPDCSGAGVYLTCEYGGAAVDGYGRSASRLHGGDPVMLEIKTRLTDLIEDPDDVDLKSGDYQWVSTMDISTEQILNLEALCREFFREQKTEKQKRTSREIDFSL